MADVIRVQKRRGKYNKYLQSPLIPIPSRTARRHKLSKASDCGKVITKRKLYNTDISSQIPESTARWQNSQPSVSDVLDDDVPDVPDEHEPVNEDSDVDCDVLAHGGTTLIGNHATTTINSDEDSDVLDDNVSDIPDELKPVNEDSDVDWDVLTHGGSSRMGNHATTAVNSDEDRDVESEDDTDIESDESSTSSHFGNCVREANNALQGDDVGMLCDEVPDAEDLRAPTMQECSSDPVSYAAGYSKDCNPCIVNSTSQHLNMKMKELPSDPLYPGAPLTTQASWLSIYRFCLANKLTDVATKQLLDLVSIHCPKPNLSPKSLYLLKNMFGCMETVNTYYCSTCYGEIEDAMKGCLKHECKTASTQVCYFTLLSFESRLKSIVEENWSTIHNHVYKPAIPGVIADISDGARFEQYKQKVTLEDQFAEHIGLILNADGVPLFKSCGQSIWPVMLALTSLPPALRMNVSNLILAGIWLGPVKPKLEMILQPVLEKLKVYGTKGIAISANGIDKVIKTM
eukprot:Em0027g35a